MFQCLHGGDPFLKLIWVLGIFTLEGHIDFTFACAWSPCGRYMATGNQGLSKPAYMYRND
jgi:hypothetical protein